MGVAAERAKVIQSQSVFLAGFTLQQIKPFWALTAQINDRFDAFLGPKLYSFNIGLIFPVHTAAQIVPVTHTQAQKTMVAPERFPAGLFSIIRIVEVQSHWI